MARHGADYGVGMPTQYAGGGHNHNALRCSAGQRPLDPRARESASGYWRSAPGEILGTHHGKDLLHGLLGVSLHLHMEEPGREGTRRRHVSVAFSPLLRLRPRVNPAAPQSHRRSAVLLLNVFRRPHAVNTRCVVARNIQPHGGVRTPAQGRAGQGGAGRAARTRAHAPDLGKRRGVSVIADQLREHLVSGADCTHASSPTGVRPWGAYSPNLEQLRA